MQLLTCKDYERTNALPRFSVRTGMRWFGWLQITEGRGAENEMLRVERLENGRKLEKHKEHMKKHF